MTANDNSKASTYDIYRSHELVKCEIEAERIRRDLAEALSLPPGERRTMCASFMVSLQCDNDLKKRKLLAGHNEIAAIFDECHCSFCDPRRNWEQNWGEGYGQTDEDKPSKPR